MARSLRQRTPAGRVIWRATVIAMIVPTRRPPRTLAGLLAGVLALSGLVAGLTLAPGPAGAAATPLLGRKVIGYSVRHRPIVAYHLGDPRKRPVLIIGQMHGNETAGVRVANSIVR